ncbi:MULTISPECIES: nuclear transport factor 2 family protein [Rhizobium/Agrobacterium group]|uniref:nuclear transport factor 2 family protein n=1 Tax=Rhizobium/Agrobacterium group TaxID=227290 RepID=UPI001ADA4914|nr:MULTISPECIES: nuclear transport factor 2 family protein [Rhizobium/Agrobacterium group]MBO9112468.1 nuclear transport factor 2 family protein [Agrobacterium sp. S2/73]QXZ75977.1 nuclear transport factor 2 family protein [Agrobacterium sp. S7/73]QYA17012.1 nuclear transport factor 2 family protein [Rhizobium sp. AB2/73]UEQ85415.1 nuclear transport factor 2 family protein [Rhizobium sp. AB2/73]
MTDERIQNLFDIEEIRNLRVLYSHYLDGAHTERLADIFTEDAVVSVTVGSMRGIEEIEKGLGEAVTLFDRDGKGNYPFLHAVTNHWVRITGPDTAEGRCYLIDFETASKPDPNPLLLLGLYSDQYRRVGGQWRISRSQLETVWPQRAGGEGRGQPGNGMTFPS